MMNGSLAARNDRDGRLFFLCFRDNGRRVTRDSQLQEWDTVAKRGVNGGVENAGVKFSSLINDDVGEIFLVYSTKKKK